MKAVNEAACCMSQAFTLKTPWFVDLFTLNCANEFIMYSWDHICVNNALKNNNHCKLWLTCMNRSFAGSIRDWWLTIKASFTAHHFSFCHILCISSNQIRFQGASQIIHVDPYRNHQSLWKGAFRLLSIMQRGVSGDTYSCNHFKYSKLLQANFLYSDIRQAPHTQLSKLS